MKPFFEKVSYAQEEAVLPVRSTQTSAWYDFFASEDVVIPSLFKALQKWEFIKPTFIPTHIKAFIPENMFLQLANRSGNPLKVGILMANWVWIVDADYYNNLKTFYKCPFLDKLPDLILELFREGLRCSPVG